MNTVTYQLQARVRRILANFKRVGKIYDYVVSENHVGVKFSRERSFVFYTIVSFLKALKNGVFEIQRNALGS